MSYPIVDVGPALLFCPGDRSERFDKAAASADLAILDLEDGVALPQKDMAREAVCAFFARGGHAAVRPNLPTTPRGRADIAALTEAGARLLLLPKTESVEEIAAVTETTGAALIASIETARGVLALEAICAHPAVAAVSWGPYDLAADMGARAVRDELGALLSPFAHVRDRLLVVAAAHGKTAIDTVTAELRDPAVISADAATGALLGFRAKFAIHPAQVAPIRAAYAPSLEEVARAERMLEQAGQGGAVLFEGEMVDEPMLRRARRILAAHLAATAGRG
jgi:citrate lyase subunit beta/citryl-CoA lyase